MEIIRLKRNSSSNKPKKSQKHFKEKVENFEYESEASSSNKELTENKEKSQQDLTNFQEKNSEDPQTSDPSKNEHNKKRKEHALIASSNLLSTLKIQNKSSFYPNSSKHKSTKEKNLPKRKIEEGQENVLKQPCEQYREKMDNFGLKLMKRISNNLNLDSETQECLNENKNLLNISKKKDSPICKNEHNKTSFKKITHLNQENVDKEAHGEKFNESQNFLNNIKENISSPASLIRLRTNYHKKTIIQSKKTLFQHNQESKNDEEDHIHEVKPSKFLIYHESMFRACWDFLIFLFVLYTILMTPIYFCFFLGNSFHKKIEAFIEIFFIVDIILNFFTTILKGEENLITRHNEIIDNYIFSWFLYDAISSYPYEFISSIYEYYFDTVRMNSYMQGNILRWLSIFRVIRIFNTQKTGRTLRKTILNANYSLNRILKFTCIFLLLTHITSCFFIFIGKISVDNTNWIYANEFQDMSNLDIYVASLYFNIVTIFTIGYGDIKPTNIIETIYVIIFMFSGSMLFSYAVSSLSTMFSDTNIKYTEYKRKKKVLKSIYQQYDIPWDLYKLLKQNLNNDFKKNENDRVELLESLPTNIKNDLFMVMFKSQIKLHSFFKNQPNEFILYVLPLLKSIKIFKGDVLTSVGEHTDEMYLVVKGSISLHLGSLYDEIEVGQVHENQHFGGLLMTLNEQSQYEIKCKSKNAEILVLKKSEFMKIKNSYNTNIVGILEESYLNFEIFNKRRQVVLELFRYFHNASVIKRKMRLLNIYLHQKGFDDYFKNNVQLEEANDFFINNDIETIKNLLDSLENYLNDSKLKSKVKGNKNKEKLDKGKKESDEEKKDISENILLIGERKSNNWEDILRSLNRVIINEDFLRKTRQIDINPTSKDNSINKERNYSINIQRESVTSTDLVNKSKTNVQNVNDNNRLFDSKQRSNEIISKVFLDDRREDSKNKIKSTNEKFDRVYEILTKNFDVYNKDLLNRESQLNEKTLNLIHRNTSITEFGNSSKNVTYKSQPFFKSTQKNIISDRKFNLSSNNLRSFQVKDLLIEQSSIFNLSSSISQNRPTTQNLYSSQLLSVNIEESFSVKGKGSKSKTDNIVCETCSELNKIPVESVKKKNLTIQEENTNRGCDLVFDLPKSNFNNLSRNYNSLGSIQEFTLLETCSFLSKMKENEIMIHNEIDKRLENLMKKIESFKENNIL